MKATHRVVSWSDSYALGMEEIDDQHKVLFDLINALWSSVVANAPPQQLLELITELEKYTISHFAAEETFMRMVSFPQFEEHKAMHEKFADQVVAERKRVAAGQGVSFELLRFLKDWLVNHILVADKDYANFCKRRPAAQPSLLGRLFGRFVAQRA